MAAEHPTGRLFRSLRAGEDATPEAIIALDVDEAVSLQSVSLAGTESDAVDPDFAHLFAPEPAASVTSPPARRRARSQEPEHPEAGTDVDPEVPVVSPRRHRRVAGSDPDGVMNTGVGPAGTVLVVVATTVLAAVADYVVTGSLGWVTGIALVLASGYAALSVRPSEAFWALVSPPLAFFIATVTVGQLTVTSGSFLVRQGLLIPLTLGRNALWIVLATALSIAIVVVRRRRILRPRAR